MRNFTLGDMARRVVIYENRGTTDAQQDGFRFRAQVLPDMTQSEDALFEVAIYPEAYWTPLNVSNLLCSIYFRRRLLHPAVISWFPHKSEEKTVSI